MAVVIDGRALAETVKERVRAQVARLARPPKLAVVMAGTDAPSLVYVRNKEAACGQTGIAFMLCSLPEDVSQREMLTLIDGLNADGSVDGILVQQPNPLPKNLNMRAVVARVHPDKDVDCLHPYNVGLVTEGSAVLLPATPAGVVALLKEAGVPMEGRRCVILGRSNVVGKPLAMMALHENATVTVCHSRTRDLSAVTRDADILIAAIRQPKFVKADMIKEGAAVIDVGVNQLEGKKICGDVDYKDCFGKAAYITKVPGGVGPMTVAMLLENCVKAYRLRHDA